MDLFTLINVILGRWRLVAPILIVSVGLAYLVQTTTPAEYEANGFLLLETPELAASDDPRPAVDPVELAEGVQLEGDAEGSDVSVAPLGGVNYSVAASAPAAVQAEQAVQQVTAAIADRVTVLQEERGVVPKERIEFRLADPVVIAELQDDGTYLVSASAFLYDPTAATMNPYQPNAYTGRILQVAMMGDAGQSRFKELAGDQVDLVVGQQARDAAALIEVMTTGPDPNAVIEAFFHAHTLMSEDLEARQERAGVLPGQRLSLAVLDAPLGVTDQGPPVTRAAAGVIILGGMLAVGLAIGLEGLKRRSDKARDIRDLIDPEERHARSSDVPGSMQVDRPVEVTPSPAMAATPDEVRPVAEVVDEQHSESAAGPGSRPAPPPPPSVVVPLPSLATNGSTLQDRLRVALETRRAAAYGDRSPEAEEAGITRGSREGREDLLADGDRSAPARTRGIELAEDDAEQRADNWRARMRALDGNGRR